MKSCSRGTTHAQRRRHRCSSFRPAVERLELRCLLAVAPMTVYEVHMLELINLARANPDQAAARYATALNQGLPAGTITSASKPPLARNDLLRDVMQQHLEDMRQNNFFSHSGSNGSTFIQRAEGAGYTPWTKIGENLVWYGMTGPLTDLFHVAEELAEGWFQSTDHRKNLMDPQFREVGSSMIAGPYTPEGTPLNAGIGGQLLGSQATDSYVTGVACTALHATFGFCDVTRPITQATVTAVRQGDGVTRSTVTSTNGDYDLQLPPGTWNLSVAATGFKDLTFTGIAVAADNIKLDLMPELATPWQNPLNPLDVTADTVVAPNDALRIIDDLNQNGPRPLPVVVTPPQVPPPFFDTSGDNFIAPNDAITIIDHLTALTRARPSSEGPDRSAARASATDSVTPNIAEQGRLSSLQPLIGQSPRPLGKTGRSREAAVAPSRDRRETLVAGRWPAASVVELSNNGQPSPISAVSQHSAELRRQSLELLGREHLQVVDGVFQSWSE